MKLPKTSSFTGGVEGVTDYNRYTERGFNDKGSYSRYFDIDKWWAELLKQLDIDKEWIESL